MSDLLHEDEAFTDETAMGLQLCAQQLARVVYALKCLGNADAATPMGAMEAFGVVMQEGMASIASAINDLAEAIRDHD